MLNSLGGIAAQFSFLASVQTTSDDDFFGFVIGFRPGDFAKTYTDYLLVDWKKGSQTGAPLGLALSRVSGAASSNDFFTHEGRVTEVARGAVRGGLGWVGNASYLFDFTYTQNTGGPGTATLGLTVCNSDSSGSVTSNCFQEFSYFTDDPLVGNIGLYTLSQQSVRFVNAPGGVLQEFEALPGTIPLPATAWMLLGGLAGLGGLRRFRRR